MTRQLGYLKVAVDPANNTAAAQEIFVAQVKEDNDNETPQIYNPPVIADTITFPLKAESRARAIGAGTTTNKEHIKIGNKHAEAYKSGESNAARPQ